MAIYYVRPDGNNTNNGLGPDITGTNKAWATISKAASVMVAGDTVYIAPGTYRETVTLTNSGSNGLPITYQGDRKCQYFLDKSAGDVIISGMNSETDTIITRGYGIVGNKSYINITNIDIENLAGAFSAILQADNCNILNCNATKGMCGSILANIGANSTVINCKFFSIGGNALYVTGTGVSVSDSILKSMGLVDVINIIASYTLTINGSIIEGSYTPAITSTTLNLNGCVWLLFIPPAGTNIGINLDAAGKVISAKGCTFIGGGFTIQASSPSIWRGCKFKDIYRLVGLVSMTTSYCEFDNTCYGFHSGASQTITGCYFKNCSTTAINSATGTVTSNSSRFYGNASNTTGTVTNNTPIYGETDVVAGIVASPTNPISGTKSLKIAGYDYGTVFMQWIPCEAGKPKTVKMKIKRNTATEGTYIRLGDQVIQMSNGIKRIGTNWLIDSNASHSGGKAVYNQNSDESISFTFTGTGIRVISPKLTSYGIAGISVDGGVETNADLYNASAVYQQNVFEQTGLSNGTHTVKVRPTKTKNASAGGYNIVIDAFEYYNGSTWTRVEAESISTSVETIDITYTHHKNELVPLMICPRVSTAGGDFIQIDDIAA